MSAAVSFRFVVISHSLTGMFFSRATLQFSLARVQMYGLVAVLVLLEH
jgi:hypothetical protein